ncbi:MAG: uracil-DNA glycosylase family protein [Terracidiphilus sp.]
MATELISINGQEVRTLKELLRPGLKAIFVGMNPAPHSVECGHYYQGVHGRRFWIRIQEHLSDLRPLPAGAEDVDAFAQGFGFADLIRRPTRSIKDLRKEEWPAAIASLMCRLEILGDKPKIIFTYKKPWELARRALTEMGLNVLRMPGPYEKRERMLGMMDELRQALSSDNVKT